MEPSSNISRLLEIMAALRDPQTGCPWDIKQSFESIKPYTLEEAYEVADAIERGDLDDLCEELGDLLLQTVFHARIAQEQGAFCFDDVVLAITKKMIRRHPHVFERMKGKENILLNDQWEAIKAEEKAERAERRKEKGLQEDQPGFLDAVPRALPALTEALKLQQRAAKVGFDWQDPEPILNKVEEEIGELRAALKEGNLHEAQSELGDLYFALTNIARYLNGDGEEALRRTNRKFRRRFAYIEKSLVEKGISLDEANLEQMDALWDEAKKKEKVQPDDNL